MFKTPSTLTSHDSTYPFIDPARHSNRLQGTIALITGAGHGLGRETALAFAAAGARVVCVAHRQADADSVAHEINNHRQFARANDREGLGEAIATAIAADVADPNAAATVVKEVQRRWGPGTFINVLVANAGMTRFNTFENEVDPSLESWWRVFEVNVHGTLSFVRAVLPEMIHRRSGVVISLASTSGSQDIPFNSAYVSSKAAVIKFNHDLGVELKGSGVHCYSLHPGSVPTDLGSSAGAVNMKAVSKNPRMMEVLSQFQALEMQTPDLAANTCVALCVEEDAKFMSGKYVDSQQDLEEVLKEAKKGKDGRVDKEKLYWLKLNEL